MKHSHLIIFSAAFGLIFATFVVSLYFWNQLPAQIPIHFGISGQPDGYTAKNIFSLFLLPVLNLAMFCLFSLIYRYPQYTSWPTTLILMTVETEKREKIYEILRSMNTWILFWLTLLFTYLQYNIIATANGRANGLEGWVMIGFLVIVLLIIVYINTRMYLSIKKMMAQKARTRSK